MNICKVWDADYPWDIRVEKVCDSLTSAGHTVHIVCRNQARWPRYERQGRLHIHRLPSLPHTFGPVHALCNLPFPVNPIWFSAIANTVFSSRADVILVRDILLALPCAVLGKLFRIPVILDMAENYPAMLRDRLRYTPTTCLGKLIRSPNLAHWVERLCLRMVDRVIVVVEESKDRLIQAGVPGNRISIVNNTPKIEVGPRSRNIENRKSIIDPVKIVYHGILDGSRGIDIAVRAVRILKTQNFPVTFTVIGNGPNFERFRDLANRQGVEDRIMFMGRLSFSRVVEIMKNFDVGLIPHYATDAWKTTIPNKLFDYMAAGLPVIVSDGMPMSRVVRQEKCGLVFRDQDPNDLADCIQALKSPGLCRKLGQSGISAVQRQYNWDYDAKILLETVTTQNRKNNPNKRIIAR